MQLIWQKGRFSWIASHPNCIIQASKQFPISEAPENQTIAALSQKLLWHGGESVVILFVEENSCAFFEQKGQVVSYNSVSLDVGEQSQCHMNSARLWQSQQDKLSLITGYALSVDQMWRRHSWLLDDEQNLIETTENRVKYYGVRLSQQQADSFCHIYLET